MLDLVLALEVRAAGVVGAHALHDREASFGELLVQRLERGMETVVIVRRMARVASEEPFSGALMAMVGRAR
jgi:hypothetical protein